MATAASNKTEASQQQLEADIAQLREDIAQLAKQLAATGEHSFEAARNAASDGVETLRAKGEEAAETLRANAADFEKQISDTVREKPITSLAVAAGVGYVFALLTSR